MQAHGSWDPLNGQFQRNQHHNPQDNRTIQHALRAEARWRILCKIFCAKTKNNVEFKSWYYDIQIMELKSWQGEIWKITYAKLKIAE